MANKKFYLIEISELYDRSYIVVKEFITNTPEKWEKFYKNKGKKVEYKELKVMNLN